MTLTRFAMFCMAGITFAGNVRAQDAIPRKPIELGVDAALSHESEDGSKLTQFTLPVTQLRVGFFVTDAVSIEPLFAFYYSRSSRENPISGVETKGSGSSYDLNVGLLYHFQPDRTRSQPYIRPFLGIRGYSSEIDAPVEISNSGSQTSLGAAIGVKVPVASRLGTRIEAGYRRGLESEPEFPATNTIFLSFGLSFFTR